MFLCSGVFVFIVIPIVLLVISGLGISYIVGRKMPLLRSLDSSSLSGELNFEVKKAILEERLKRRLGEPMARLATAVRPGARHLSSLFKTLYSKIVERERAYRAAVKHASVRHRQTSEQSDIIEEHLSEAKTAELDEDAEAKYLEVLAYDQGNLEAYEGLARIYVRKNELENARELYEHLHKLGTNKVEHFIELAETWLLEDQARRALRVLKGALRVHPRNPKLVDKLVQVAIMLQDSGLAKDFVKRLAEVNPDNNKIEKYKKTIKEM